MTIVVDGRKIRDELSEKLSSGMIFLAEAPSLAIVVVGENPVINQFVKSKEKFGKNLGFNVSIFKFEENITNDDLKKEIIKISKTKVTGISIELPLPRHLNTEEILNCVPINKDVDVLSEEGRDAFALGRLPILPPVVGAISEISERYSINFKKSKVVLVGKGRLVGEPVSTWFKILGIKSTILVKGDDSLEFHLKGADIVISGTGVPSLIKPSMIKDGSILIDAGTAEEENGGIVGDINPSCSEKSSIFVPVPGGIGPMTVFFLYKNVLDYAHFGASGNFS